MKKVLLTVASLIAGVSFTQPDQWTPQQTMRVFAAVLAVLAVLGVGGASFSRLLGVKLEVKDFKLDLSNGTDASVGVKQGDVPTPTPAAGDSVPKAVFEEQAAVLSRYRAAAMLLGIGVVVLVITVVALTAVRNESRTQPSTYYR